MLILIACSNAFGYCLTTLHVPDLAANAITNLTDNPIIIALLLLLGFSLSIAGLNPMIVACAGEMTTAASMGIMLPTAGLGAILMPWVIGMVAQTAGLRIGMAVNILPCVGMLMLSSLLHGKG